MVSSLTAIRPTTWWPGISGYCTSRRSPCQACTSAPDIAVASTASQPPASTGWEGIFVAASCRGSTSTMALAACPSSTMGTSVGQARQGPDGGGSDRAQGLRQPLHPPLQVGVGEGIREAGVAGGAERLTGDEGHSRLLQHPLRQVERRGEPVAEERRQVGEDVEGAFWLQAAHPVDGGEDLEHLAAAPVERLAHLLHHFLGPGEGGEGGPLADVGDVGGEMGLEA